MALAHDDAEEESGLAVVPDEEGRGVLVPALDARNVRELDGASPRYDWRVPDLLQLVERAVEADEDLGPARVDRPRRRHQVLGGEG